MDRDIMCLAFSAPSFMPTPQLPEAGEPSSSVEFYRPNPGSEQIHVFGVASDSKDNIYKLVFNTI